MKTNQLFIATSLGVCLSSVTAQNYWQSTQGLEGRNVRSLAVGVPNNMFAATLDSGIYRSTDSGQLWVRSSNGLTNRSTWSVVVDPNSPSHIYTCTAGSGVFRSTDSGTNWTQTGFRRNNAFSILINAFGHMFVATLDTGIHRSTDNGNTWQRVSGPEVGSDVYSLATNSLGHIFAGTDARIFRSTDNGNTWVRSDSGVVVTGVIWSIAVSPSGHMFAGDGGGFFTGPGSVYRSVNDGNYWTQTSMTNRSALALVVNSTGHIFAGTDSGAVISTDNGNSGTRINSGLTSLLVSSLAIDSSGYIYAGTFGGGVFRSTRTTTSLIQREHNAPRSYTLHQNYPNPFNARTSIDFEIPYTDRVVLKIFDVLGREVTILLDLTLPQGNYSIHWDASELSSGSYFYRLESQNYFQTKKLFLLR